MCPDTDPRKLKQSKEKQCDRFPACNGEPLVYHCARYKESLVEVCAPRHVITGNFVFCNNVLSCKVFNVDNVDK